ncbi:MAG: hypothetical protein HS111_25300 [Kofleriaceae bacterium]|nr:hypothetical protein [Kofleriaceae bacterium]
MAKGVKGVLVVSAGFAETGEEGKARQDALLARVRGAGMRMVGPNCLGLLNADPEVALDATFAPTWPPHGGVAFSSQSGAVGLAILDYAAELGVGIHQFVSIGNKADVSGNDLIEHWGADPAVSVVLLYLESFGNPTRFLRICREVARRASRSSRSRAAAPAPAPAPPAPHTGALAGLETAVEALIHQAGVIRTDTIEELFDVAMVLAHQPVPRGDRVALLTNAGGPGIMAADACESHGLRVGELSPHTVAALRAFLPPEASVRNPVDMIASATPAAYEPRALPLLLADPEIDAVIVMFVPPVGTEAAAVAAAIQRGGAGAAKPILTSFMGMRACRRRCRRCARAASRRTPSPRRRRSPWPGWCATASGWPRPGTGGRPARRRSRPRPRRDRRPPRLAARRRDPRGPRRLRPRPARGPGGDDRRRGGGRGPRARPAGRGQAGVGDHHPQVRRRRRDAGARRRRRRGG